MKGVGMRVSREVTDSHVSVRGAFDPPAREDAVGITVDQQPKHHLGRVLLRAAATPVDLQRAQPHPLDGLHDEVHHVRLRHPAPQMWRKKHGRIPVDVDESGSHADRIPTRVPQCAPKVRQAPSPDLASVMVRYAGTDRKSDFAWAGGCGRGAGGLLLLLAEISHIEPDHSSFFARRQTTAPSIVATKTPVSVRAMPSNTGGARSAHAALFEPSSREATQKVPGP